MSEIDNILDNVLGKEDKGKKRDIDSILNTVVGPQTSRQNELSRFESGEFDPTSKEQLEQSIREAGITESGQAIPTRELETLAILGTSAIFPPAAVGPAALGTVGRTALGTGLIGSAENVAIETASSIAEGELPSPKDVAVSAGVGFGAGALGGAASQVIPKFSAKVKALAKLRKTSPNQANKLINQTAKAKGVSRGEAVDELIEKTVKSTDNTDKLTKFSRDLEISKIRREVLAEVSNEGVGGGDLKAFHREVERRLRKRIAENPQLIEKQSNIVSEQLADADLAITRKSPDKILPETFDADVFAKELDVFQTPREAPKRTLKNVNLDRLDDEQLSRFIDSAAKQSPEFQIPNETVAHDVLRTQARKLGIDTIDKFLDDVNAGRIGTPEGGIRRIATEVIAAENVLKDHLQNKTMKIAREVAEGAASKDKLREAIITDLRLLRKIGGVSSEFGRALGSRRIKATGEVGMEQRFLKQISKVTKDQNLDDIALRLSNIDILDPTQRLQFLRDLTKSTTRQKIDEIWFNSILSGPITQARNFLGNTATIIVRETERPVAAGVDVVRAAITRTPRQRFFRESVKSSFGLLEGVREGLHAGWKSFRTEVPQFGIDATKIEIPRRRLLGAIPGRTGRIIRLPGRALQGVDDFFKAIGYRMELNARAYREARKMAIKDKLNPDEMLDVYNALRRNPTEILDKAAKDEALTRTFQTESGRVGRGLISARNALPGAEFLVPFLRTPINIAEFAIERVPVVNLASIANRRAQGLTVDLTEEAAKTLLGMGIGAGAFLAHKHGLINGGMRFDTSRGKERAFFAGGGQNYAFNIGDTSIAFQNFEPASSILGMMADAAELTEMGVPILSEDMALGMAKSISKNVTSKSFGQGFDTLFAVLNADTEQRAGEAKRGLLRTIGGFIPFSSLQRNIAQGLDPTIRSQRTLEDAVTGNIPGFRSDLEPIIDLWGNEVVTEEGILQRMGLSGTTGQLADALMNPVKIREIAEDPATVEVNRLVRQFPDEPFRGLGKVGRTVRGRELTSQEYVAYAKLSGQIAYQSVTELMNSSYYNRLENDAARKEQIEKRLIRAREIARNELFGP